MATFNRRANNQRPTVNPYLTFLLGKGFKNMMVCILTVTLIIIIIIAVAKSWIDKEMSLNVAYLVFGALLGKWLSNGKK